MSARPPRKSNPGKAPRNGQEKARATADPGGPDLEPSAGNKAIPALWFGILGALLFWGDMYIMNNGGDLMGDGGSFPQAVYYPYQNYKAVVAANPKRDTGPFEDGRIAYNKYCLACHQSNGNGLAGQFPPLAGSEWVLAEGPNRLIRIVLDGLVGPIQVKGQSFNGVMVSWRDTIPDDKEIAAVLTYIRQEWGNKASDVDPAKVTELREATKGRAGRAWTAAELEGIPVAD